MAYSVNSLFLTAIHSITDDIINSNSPTFLTVSFLASIVTILGFFSLFVYLYRRRISRKCQRRIIMDMIRHLFVNCAIGEAIRISMTKENFRIRPNNGVFAKFAFLQTDADLSRFAVNASNFEMIHQVCLYIRNYGIVANVAESHFEDPQISIETKIAELNDLFNRAVNTTKRLIKLGKKLNLGINEQKVVKELIGRRPDLKRSGLWNLRYTEQEIPDRTDRNSKYFFEEYPYYDNLGLGELLNDSIMNQGHSIYFVPMFPKSNQGNRNRRPKTENKEDNKNNETNSNTRLPRKFPRHCGTPVF